MPSAPRRNEKRKNHVEIDKTDPASLDRSFHISLDLSTFPATPRRFGRAAGGGGGRRLKHPRATACQPGWRVHAVGRGFARGPLPTALRNSPAPPTPTVLGRTQPGFVSQTCDRSGSICNRIDELLDGLLISAVTVRWIQKSISPQIPTNRSQHVAERRRVLPIPGKRR